MKPKLADKGITKIGAEINKIGTKKTTEKINETNSLFLEKKDKRKLKTL